jgi:hypothetical protein
MNLKSHGKFTLKTIACCASLGAGLQMAGAQSLLFDFGPTTVAAPYLTLDPGHSLGAISGSDTSWNIITTSTATSSLIYGDGASTSGLTLSLGQEATFGSSIISYSTAIASVNLAGTGGGTAGQQNLLTAGSIYGDDTTSTAVGRDGFFGGGTGGAGAAIGLRLDGLAAGNYLIYVMARNVNTDVASSPMNIFASTGASADTFDFSALTGSAEANTGYPSATYAGQYSTFQDGENYVGLNVTIGSGDYLFLAIDGDNSIANNTRGFLNMVEITPAPAPEPSTWAMFGMGILTLGLVFKKRRTVA